MRLGTKNWRQELAAAPLTPHILVEADRSLTERLWQQSEVKPFVLSPQIWGCEIRNEVTADGQFYACRLPAIDLIRHLLGDGSDGGSMQDLRAFLAGVRRHFELGNGRLRLVVVGTHTSISNQAVVGYEHDAGDMDYLHENEFVPCRRRHRQLGGLLGVVFRSLWRVDTVWLSRAFPELCPKQTDLMPEYELLGATAREALATVAGETVDEAGIRLKRPALPLIYVRSPAFPEWAPFVPVDGRRPYSTTDMLIRQFGEAKRAQPSLEGVLVKVLAENLEEYSPVDPPLVGDTTLALARDANLRAILLDRDVGIVRPCGLRHPSLPQIYRV